MFDILITSRRKVVNDRDFVSFIYKFVGEMASHETCAARD